MVKMKQHTPPTPEVASAPIRAFADRLYDLLTEANNDARDPSAIVWVLLSITVEYIRVHEDGDRRKAIKIIHMLTRRMTKMHWIKTVDGGVLDLTTGETINTTRQ